jgi:putative transposase
MKRARFTEEQIIGILRENEAGAKAGELARKHGVSERTIYAWKAKFGGMSVSDAQRLKAPEDENRRLKSLLADAMLDKAALNELLEKNGRARRCAPGRRSSADDRSHRSWLGVCDDKASPSRLADSDRSWARVHCSGVLSGRQRSSVVPCRNRPPVTWS